VDGNDDRGLTDRVSEKARIRAEHLLGIENPDEIKGSVAGQSEGAHGHDRGRRHEQQADQKDDGKRYGPIRHRRSIHRPLPAN